MKKSQQDQQNEFDDVSRAYREQDSETTPAALDRRVLQAARRELDQDVQQRWLFVFTKPLALAAAAALLAVIVINVEHLPGMGTPGIQTPLQAGSDAYPGNSSDSGFCNDTEIATIEGWQACIAELESSGRTEDAASERSRLRRAHPGAGELAR